MAIFYLIRYLIGVVKCKSLFPRLPPIGFILNKISFYVPSNGTASNLLMLLCSWGVSLGSLENRTWNMLYLLYKVIPGQKKGGEEVKQRHLGSKYKVIGFRGAN